MLSKSDWLGIALTAIGVAAGFLMGGTMAGIICLALGLIAIVIWHRTNDNGLADPRDALGLSGNYQSGSSTFAILQQLGAKITFQNRPNGPPTRHEWEKTYTQFRKFKVILDAEWDFDEGGHVSWNIPPTNRRAVQEFKGLAGKAGRLARRAGFVPRLFRTDAATSDDDYWLAVVATRVEHRSNWEHGFNSGAVDNIAEASRIVCDVFINETPE